MWKKRLPSLNPQWILPLLSLLYLLWALAYIYRSSYAASNGARYFNLFDDAMISMRYAWNFAHGNGLVWNIGERVEGYTNLLMTLLMSAAAFIFNKRYAVLSIQLTGIFFMLGAAFFAAKIYQLLAPKKDFWSLPFLLVLLYYPLNFWSLMGMETGLLAFLLGAGVYASLRYEKTRRVPALWLMSIAFGLAHLTRNESILFAALAFLYLLPAVWRDKKSLQYFFLAGILYSLFVVGQIGFRYFYYGGLVPNTYTLKLVGMTLTQRLQNGWGFIAPYLLQTAPLILFAFFGFFRKPTKTAAYLLSFLLVSIVYQIYVGGDAWDYWRIMSPVMPFLFVVTTCAAADFSAWAESSSARRIALFLLPLIFLLVADIRFLREMTLLDPPHQYEDNRLHIEAAIALNELTEEEATIGVYWAGTLPYYLDRYAIDFLGKTDPYIANLPPDQSGQIANFGVNSIPGHNKYNLEYSIKTLKPTYVEEFTYGNDDLSGWAREHYVLIKQGETKLSLLKDSPYVRWERVKDFLKW